MNQEYNDNALPNNQKATDTQSVDDGIQFGYINPVDASIISIIYLLSQDPAYMRMPLARVGEIILAIREKRYLAAVQDQNCIAALLYVTLSCDTAQRCILEERLPRKEEVDPKGTDILLTATTGKRLNLLIREFRRLQRGRLILFERHYKQGKTIHSAQKRFSWFDRKGVLRGELV